MNTSIPASLQPVFWTVSTEKLKLKKDQVYIIHQVLAYGSVSQIKWLFKTYPLKTIKKIFTSKPVKTYRPEAFNYAKNALLKLNNHHLDEKNYVINTPRNIR